MNRMIKMLLGIATMWPLVYVAIFFAFWFYIALWVTTHPQETQERPPGMIAIFVVHGITILWVFMLLGIYLRDVFKNERIDRDKKALWAVVLFFGNIFAMPVYWYLYIWPEIKSSPDASRRAGSAATPDVGLPQ